MRLSISFSGFAPIVPGVAAVLAAEEAGFDGVWTAEHLGFHDAIVPSTIYARETERLEIGIVGLSTAGRHPAMAAMELASLSELAPGRVRVQVGTGDPTLVAKLGKEVKAPARSTTAFVNALRQTLMGRDMKETHPEFSFDGFRMTPMAPAPPIDVMAIRPKMVQTAAQVGDGLSVSVGASQEYLRDTVAVVEKELEAAGRDRSQFRITALAIAAIVPDLEMGYGPLGAMLSMFPQETAAYLARGVVDPEELVAIERDGGAFEVMKYWTPERIDAIAIVTTPDGVAAKLAAYAESGIDELGLMFVNPADQLPDLVRLVGAARP